MECTVDTNSIYEDSIELDKNDIYLNKFNDFKPKQIRDVYRHLYKSKKVIYAVNNEYSEAKCLKDIVQENYILLNMAPYVVMFQARNNLQVKVIKIVDDNWFPHMRPELYENDLVSKVGGILNKKRVNYSNWIPFA